MSVKRTKLSGISRYAETNGSNQAAIDNASSEAGPSRIDVPVPAPVKEGIVVLPFPSRDRLVNELRQMVSGYLSLNESRRAPGNYVAIDCEMVGLGHLGAESALARVSVVNYHGHILLDTFVATRERVTDWRTWVSGVREADLVGAPGFAEVQAKVASLLERRVVVGHALDNDLGALLLTHPGPMVRDTQKCKALREKAKNKHPGLKKLCALELGLEIQKGSHSSVTDARAAMALYRLHKVEWEQQVRQSTDAWKAKNGKGREEGAPETANPGKRKRDADIDDMGEEVEDVDEGARKRAVDFPGGGRKGISSGLSVVVRRNGQKVGTEHARKRARGGAGDTSGEKWWEQAAG